MEKTNLKTERFAFIPPINGVGFPAHFDKFKKPYGKVSQRFDLADGKIQEDKGFFVGPLTLTKRTTRKR